MMFTVARLEQTCIDLKLSMSQKVENEGFHRDINWLIESLTVGNEEWKNSNCKVSLLLDVPPKSYVEGDVNVETPAHESKEHKVYVFLKDYNIEKASVQLPVHLRYQRAAIAGGFGKVNLIKPTILVLCPIAGRELCGEHQKIVAPCDDASQHMCVWNNITYQALFDDVQLFVPIGDLDDYPVVAIITLLLGCVGSIYILSLLSTMPL
ncbi:hypothetical protein FQA39_LY03071 [Lamprigera yunnana]|nr:hypothetical protein FQA39_LY03071 [Lamprigera yunnana]